VNTHDNKKDEKDGGPEEEGKEEIKHRRITRDRRQQANKSMFHASCSLRPSVAP
jgi:hypothetical protein